MTKEKKQDMAVEDQKATSEVKTDTKEVSEPEASSKGAYLEKEVPQNPEDSGPIGGDFFENTEVAGEWHATVIGQTPGGKTLQVMKKRDGAGYVIAFNPGGELPKELDGVWTTYDRAEKAARLWLNEQHAKTVNA